jgi:hypothetical protein
MLVNKASSILLWESFLIFRRWEREAGFMPASRRRSISPPTKKVKPTLAHKNFAGAGSSVETATLQIFRVFRAFRGQKNSVCRSMEKIICFFRLKILLGRGQGQFDF